MASYTPQSPLVGLGLCGADTVQAWFVTHNPSVPHGLGDIIVEEASKANVNEDIVAAQCAHETGYWTSYAAVHLNNPAGLGITNGLPQDQEPGFPSMQAGIHSMVAHLLTYIDGASNPWKADDPRYAATQSSDMFGKARTIQDLEQHWAYTPEPKYSQTPPDQRYAARIAALANELVTFGAQHMANGRDPQADWQPSSNYDQGRDGYAISHLTFHLTAGTDSLSWLRGKAGGSSNANSSANYLNERDGHIYQLVDENDTPWTDGDLAYNRSGISVENEAKDGEGFTDPQINALIALAARIAQRRGWTKVVHPTDNVLPEAPRTPPAGTGFVYGHYQIPDPNNPSMGGGIDHHVNCPGPLFPWDRVINGINAQLAGNQPAPQPSQDRVYFKETQHWLALGFKAFWEKFGGLPIFGFPISEEFQMNGLTVQYFEKGARLEWHAGSGGNPPNPWDVMEGNTGSERLDDLKKQFPAAFAPQKGPQ